MLMKGANEMGKLSERGSNTDFLNGLYVCHHHNGVTNAVLFGEQISIGKGKSSHTCAKWVVTE